MNGRRQLLVTLAAAALGACSSEPKPKPAPPLDELPKVGVVAHIAELKERQLTRDNWKSSIGGLFSNDLEATVIATRYEVTVFYDDSTTGVVTVDQKPNYTAGQRVRVTGNRIEAMRR